MKVHKGMRPHDIPILLKIIALGNKPWMNKDLAASLLISASEISDSLSRSVYAGLIGADRRSVNLK
jgi:predicted transcriptional regulator